MGAPTDLVGGFIDGQEEYSVLLGYNADADAPQAETQSFVATLDDSTSVVRTWWIEDEGGGVQYCDARGSDEACDVNVLVDLRRVQTPYRQDRRDGEGMEALRLTVRALRLLCNASRLTCDGDACAPLGCVVGPGGSNA